jgi:hypothetical protein
MKWDANPLSLVALEYVAKDGVVLLNPSTTTGVTVASPARLPIVESAGAVYLGPIITASSPCIACAAQVVDYDVACVECPESTVNYVVLRLLDALFTDTLFPLSRSVLRIGLDSSHNEQLIPVHYRPRCTTCDTNFRDFPTKAIMVDNRPIEESLTRLGFLLSSSDDADAVNAE